MGAKETTINLHAQNNLTSSYEINDDVSGIAFSGEVLQSINSDIPHENYIALTEYLMKQRWARDMFVFDSSPASLSILSRVGILGVTDVNNDENIEVWLVYKTLYDQLAIQIVTIELGNVSEVLNYCLACD